MIKEYNENHGNSYRGFKRKCLIPLFLIVLCMIALTGQAYAYSTSVTGQDNISGNYYSIDMYAQDGADYTVVNKSLTSGDNFIVQTSKTVGSNYYASVDETVITFNTKVMVSSNDPSDCKIAGNAQYVQNSGSAAMYSAWAEEGAVTCDVKVINDSGYFEPGKYYDVEVKVTLSEIESTNLGTADPREIAENVKFNGNDCIKISLNASR